MGYPTTQLKSEAEVATAFAESVLATMNRKPKLHSIRYDLGQYRAETGLPKLFVAATPGALLTGRALDFCRTWPNQREINVKGIHYIQEDSPAEIGTALQRFMRR